MERHAVLTTIGDDRTGLVDEVTRFVAECGGNLEDSRMVNLHGQFAMMMLVEGSPETIECLRARLPELAEASRLHAQLTPADLGPRAAAPAVPFRLTTAAMDHPGLVQSVSHLMRRARRQHRERRHHPAAGADHRRAAVRDGDGRLGAGGHAGRRAARGCGRALRRSEHGLAAHRALAQP